MCATCHGKRKWSSTYTHGSLFPCQRDRSKQSKIGTLTHSYLRQHWSLNSLLIQIRPRKATWNNSIKRFGYLKGKKMMQTVACLSILCQPKKGNIIVCMSRCMSRRITCAPIKLSDFLSHWVGKNTLCVCVRFRVSISMQNKWRIIHQEIWRKLTWHYRNGSVLAGCSNKKHIGYQNIQWC